MFDFIDGVPMHPLFLHAPIVLIPITALLTLAFLVPRWRWALRWPIAILAVLAAGATYATVKSGEELKSNLELGGEIAAAIDAHETWGDRLLYATIVMAVLAVVAAIVVTRTAGVAATVVAVLLAISGITAAWLTYETGDRGSRAVWCATGLAAGETDSLEECLRT
ncbi:hypothetical protein FE697_009850 [Mumia zhuanghuii]|uniref:DUF2231 domain-containing protein n=2 Tax=Mumia TaxID=1546255 RepID=A0ABW1QQ06_9ACTN|nr:MULTISPECIES: DUF2231 domain-containing protein [Mumia]KAA1423852.1 hypothetical protein FE697_009850 [Mumia zhuanghuii]